jgi:predicted TIM-barrel fold metal-dependent hydrolase
MIVDSHAHIFEKWSGACGLPNRTLHWQYLQKNLTNPSAKIFRLRDGAPSNTVHLSREGSTGWSGLRDDVDFRVGPYGRVEFTVDGEDHYVQYMPVSMYEIESTPEGMITHMNAAGVNHMVLQAGFTYGYMNDYNALAQHQFPERFTGLFHVDEARANSAFWMAETRRAIENLDLKGMYYSVEQFSRYDFDVWLDDSRFDDFWSLIEQSHRPVFIEFSAIPGYDRASYVVLMERFRNLVDRYPAIRWVCVMSPHIKFFSNDGKWDIPELLDGLYRRDNVWVETCYPISWGGIYDYPYQELQVLMRGLHNLYGADKLVWGSDMPNVERFCTYKQSLDYIRRYCDFMTTAEMDRLLGGNLVDLLGIPVAAS